MKRHIPQFKFRIYYSGREAPSLKMGSVCFSYFYLFIFFGGRLPVFCSLVCSSCLTWLYELFVRTLISPTNAYAGCGRPTTNFIECFVLGRSLPFRQRSHFITSCQSGASIIVCIQIYMSNCLARM